MEDNKIQKLKEEIEYQKLLKELDAVKRPTLRQRALALIDELEPIKKIKKGEGGAIYAHYTHNDVQQAVMSLLPKYGIFMNTEPTLDKDKGLLIMHVRFEDAYNVEEAIVTSTPVTIASLKDERGAGTAMSYALKYSLMREFGLGGEKDADEFLTQEQVDILEEGLSELKNPDQIRERIFEIYKVKSLRQIEMKDFQDVKKNILKTKAVQQAKETKTQ